MKTDGKIIEWMGSSLKDLRDMPHEIKCAFGHALHEAQTGRTPTISKLMKGELKGVWELKERDEAGTYRLMYTLKYKDMVFVLHTFQKKSNKGIATPKKELDLIKQRLNEAKELYKANYEGK